MSLPPTWPSQFVAPEGEQYHFDVPEQSSQQQQQQQQQQFQEAGPQEMGPHSGYQGSESLHSQAQYSISSEFLRIPQGTSVVEPDSVFEENGRLYHGYKEGKYFLPNDAAEQDRLDVQHAAIKVALGGKLSIVPFTTPPARVMDIATGTGIWAMEFAEENPGSHVIGTDLSNIQPERNLPNIEFVKEDSEEEWLYTDKFDYIHARMVVTCFNDPALVLQHALKNLNPGGWIEYQDVTLDVWSPDGSHKGSLKEYACSLMRDGMRAKGRDPQMAQKYKDMLYESGLVDVVERTFDLPHSGWSHDPKLKRVGNFMLLNSYDGLRGVMWKLLTGIGWSSEAIEKFVVDVQKEMLDPKVRTYVKMYVVYGRKPYEGELKNEKEK